MTDSAPTIEVSQLSKYYPIPRTLWSLLRGQAPCESICALDRVSLSVAQGEVLGLMGPNGAGKTTLINVLCTLLTPSSGQVRVGGHDVCKSPELARKAIGLVTSNERSFYWRLTGRQNLRFFAELYQVPAAEAEPRITEFLEALDLTAYADRRFDGYSTGIRQRFAVARSLLHRPRILFMDEPTKGLDPNASFSLLQLIRQRILQVWRPTIIITSHNLTEIEALCDRVAIIDHGRLLRIGTIGELARSIRGYEGYRIELAASSEGVLAGLRALLGPSQVRQRAGDLTQLELGLSESSGGLSGILRCILDHGGIIRRCEPLEVSLADVFRQVVRPGSAG